MRILLLLLIVILPKSGVSQELECDKFYIFDLRDTIINFSPVVLFKMYTDTNTANLGTYTTLSFIDQNSDTLNQWPSYSYDLPIANTQNDTLEYGLWYDNGFTSFPANFDGILLMDVPYCEVPYNHTSISTPIENIENSPIQFFPNPSSERVIVSNISGINITSIELYNSTGKLMRIETFKFDEVNISNLESGIYYIKIYSNNEEVVTGKIIKN